MSVYRIDGFISISIFKEDGVYKYAIDYPDGKTNFCYENFQLEVSAYKAALDYVRNEALNKIEVYTKVYYDVIDKFNNADDLFSEEE